MKPFFPALSEPGKKRDYFEKQRVTYFERFEALLDGTTDGPHWLGEDRIASIVADAIHFRDKKEYDMLAFCIMPNHVHMVVTVGRRDPSPYNAKAKKPEYPLTAILENLKWFTAIECNKVLNRKGQFWQHESYDHVIRDGEELECTLWYVMNNPVSARLVDSREQWQWSYCKPGLLE